MTHKRMSSAIARRISFVFLGASFVGCSRPAVDVSPPPVEQKTVSTNIDQDGDGKLDREVSETSNVLKNGTVVSSSIDEKGIDGKKKGHVQTKYQYANGQMTGKSIEYDDDGDGTVDRSETVKFSYGPKGELAREVFDRFKPESSRPVYRAITTFGLAGASPGGPSSKTMEIDEDANGIVDIRDEYKFTYTDKGALKTEQVEQFNAPTGKVRSRSQAVYTYNEKGALFTKTINVDSNGDGVSDRKESIKWTYGPDGSFKSQATEYDDNADGKIDRREVSLAKAP
jgi:hypothetical protein